MQRSTVGGRKGEQGGQKTCEELDMDQFVFAEAADLSKHRFCVVLGVRS